MQTAPDARSRPVILDGALGTELERRGFPTTLPLWSAKALLEAPNLVWEIHKDYVAAGADVLSACTFRTTPYTLAKVGLQHRAEELTHQAIRYARAATAESSNIKHQTSNPILVAGSIAPMEDCYNPELAPASGILRTEHARFAKMLVDAGADLLLVETQNSAREAIIAAQAALATSLPVWVSLMPKSATEIFNGDPLAETAQRIHNLGAEVVLLNCARPAIIAGAFGVLATTLPGAAIGLYPNLISPSSASAGEGRDAGSFAAWLSRFAPPASVLGGCCGTTPEHIAELVKLLTRRGGSMGAGNP